ncbi:MAG: hypothetical protein V4795_00435 [Pseudomonadota bacterium]
MADALHGATAPIPAAVRAAVPHPDPQAAAGGIAALPQGRRRLAPNLACLFAEDRPAVANGRRRGRLPSSVVRLNTPPRLQIGDLAELCNCRAENRGLRVRLLRQYDDGDWEIAPVQGLVVLMDGSPALYAAAPPDKLRRVPGAAAKGGAA